MSVPRIYLETTMFSFYHETRKEASYQEYREQARRIFDRVKAGDYDPYTSILATDEIDNEPSWEKREKMWRLVTDYDVKILPADNNEVKRLAALYIREGAISPAYETDAAHIAIAAFNGLDFIVSLNFTHIVRVWTIEKVRRVNAREGYQGIGIYKPSEVLEL